LIFPIEERGAPRLDQRADVEEAAFRSADEERWAEVVVSLVGAADVEDVGVENMRLLYGR
jgi:hypothetical protein